MAWIIRFSAKNINVTLALHAFIVQQQCILFGLCIFVPATVLLLKKTETDEKKIKNERTTAHIWNNFISFRSLASRTFYSNYILCSKYIQNSKVYALHFIRYCTNCNRTDVWLEYQNTRHFLFIYEFFRKYYFFLIL